MEGDLRTSGFHAFLATHVATSDAFVRIYWFGGEFGAEMWGKFTRSVWEWG